MYFPLTGGYGGGVGSNFLAATVLQLDAAGEMGGFMGSLYIDGAPTAAKDCTAAGGCSITWRTGGTVTWGGGDDTINIGIQDLHPTTGPPVQPDEVMNVYGTFVSGTDSFSATTTYTADMETDGADTSYAHADMIAIVFDLSSCNGCRIDVATSGGTSSATGWPAAGLKTGGTWAANAVMPNALITFDDGTLGWIYGTVPNLASSGSIAYGTGSNPDEYGVSCVIDHDAIVEGVYWWGSLTDAGGAELSVYIDPTGTPTEPVTAITLDSDQTVSSATNRISQLNWPTEFLLKANTRFAVTFRATTATNVSIVRTNVTTAGHMAMLPGGTNCYEVTRNGDSGVFTEVTTARPHIGLVIKRPTAAGCRASFMGGTCY
jgi:hypothetical protein